MLLFSTWLMLHAAQSQQLKLGAVPHLKHPLIVQIVIYTEAIGSFQLWQTIGSCSIANRASHAKLNEG